MSFQDVGRPGGGARGQQRGRIQSSGGAFSSAAAKGGIPRGNNNNTGSSAAMGNSLSQGLGGYEQVSDSIVQYQVCMCLCIIYID